MLAQLRTVGSILGIPVEKWHARDSYGLILPKDSRVQIADFGGSPGTASFADALDFLPYDTFRYLLPTTVSVHAQGFCNNMSSATRHAATRKHYVIKVARCQLQMHHRAKSCQRTKPSELQNYSPIPVTAFNFFVRYAGTDCTSVNKPSVISSIPSAESQTREAEPAGAP